MKLAIRSRRFLRALVYRLGMDRLLPSAATAMGAAEWDEKLSGEWRSYLDDTTSIAMRDTLIALLVQRRQNDARILDMACAGGSLRQRLGSGPGAYVGVDISGVAIDQARARNPGTEFHVASIEDFETDERFDIIIFSEVLYYLDVPAAIAQVMRYTGFLKEGGAVLVSMKDDPKSDMIFKGLYRKLSWSTGILSQVKPDMPAYATARDPARPAFLIGVFEKQADDDRARPL